MHLIETDHDRRLDAIEAGKRARTLATRARYANHLYRQLCEEVGIKPEPMGGCPQIAHDATFMAMKDRDGFMEGYNG